MAVAYVGLGANVGDPAQQVRAAVAVLARLPGTRVQACSSLYRSAPVGVTAQPDFVNAVCALQTELPAHELLHALLDVERAHGRVRGAERGAPRPLDLDLLLYGAVRCADAELTLPHPRMHARAFVLAPLAEIAPEIEVPGRGKVTTLLRDCVGQRVERAESW